MELAAPGGGERRRPVVGVVVVTALLVAAFLGPDVPAAPEDAPKARLDLRLAHVRDGLRGVVKGGDLANLPKSEIYEVARKAGVDLANPPHPLLIEQYANGRLFYVFYKTTENAFGDRPYVIQRIRKTERTWASPDAAPVEKTTWQVEVFKTIAGALKSADQHHGSFGIGEHHHREIVKEYEVGFGEVPGHCEGTSWPFPPGSLYELLQPYGEEVGLHATTRFTASRTWTLTVSLAKDGSYRVASPELGFDAPTDLPTIADATPPPDDSSREIVLEAGVGPKGVAIGTSTAHDLRQVLGATLEDVEVGKGHRNLSFGPSLTCNLSPGGRLNTVLTRPGFAGRTKEGLAHGDPRSRAREVLGAPQGQAADAPSWKYPGLLVVFDGFDRVSRLVVHAATR